MEALERYLRHVYRIRSSGEAVAETSYYPALEELFNAIGTGLTPRVYCVVNIKNRGAGIPDLGLFLDRPLAPKREPEPWSERVPERGVLEAKGPGRDVRGVARGRQVTRYLDRYGKVLITNYRQFLLLTQDEHGNPRALESYQLANSEAAFWAVAGKPATVVGEHTAAFADFLKRVLLHDAPLGSPQDLAWFLAGYARTALARISDQKLDALRTVREALEEAVGLKIQGEKGERFFHSALVQTLFYGVFSAWVLWSSHDGREPTRRFEWRQAGWSLNVPMVRILFEQIATPSQLAPLGLDELMDWSEDVLNRVNRALFFERFEKANAVQYFYEPFLHAFDPDLRKELGVWYTPPEVVKYMVARVDKTLRVKFALPDGLADPRVVVLDPCAGTGSYLLEVLTTIARTLTDRRGDALVANDLKRAAMERVFGFELLPAPFVVAHLQLGLLLASMGAPLDQRSGERVGVYLTNSLTGWNVGPHAGRIPFPELEQERDAAEAVKREALILVILGNPPYNSFAGVSPQEEGGLIDPYKAGLWETWGIRRDHLDDLYIRFWRMAERRITEITGEGIVCYISNFSWLADPTAVVMRSRFLDQFDSITIDCLNGDSRETGKRTPEGLPDPSVFSTRQNPAGITVGTAITLAARQRYHKSPATVAYRDFWGVSKRADLLAALVDSTSDHEVIVPSSQTRFSFRPGRAGSDYFSWPAIVDLSDEPPSLGLNENRGGTLIDVDSEALTDRMRVYLDPKAPYERLPSSLDGLTRDWAGFDPTSTRTRVIASHPSLAAAVQRFLAKPLDVRWAFVDTTHPLWNRSRPELVRQTRPGQRFLVVRRRAPRADDGSAFLLAAYLGDQHCLHKDAYFFPFDVFERPDGSLFELQANEGDRANLSEFAASYLRDVGVPDGDPRRNELLWLHALAIGYSPAYLAENAGGIKSDWPRIPLPATETMLRASAAYGRRLGQLIDPLVPVSGVTEGRLEEPISSVARLKRVGGGALDPAEDDLAVTAGWGIRGQGGAAMPGSGRLVFRDFHTDSALVGGQAVDVFLNDRAYWDSVPIAAWQLKIGGFQVAKKWLSYRDLRLLERPITVSEAREFTALIRRLTAIVLLGPELDANYKECASAPYVR